MIAADQPKIFKSGLRVAMSSIVDGNMKEGIHEPGDEIYENRRKFLGKHMIAMQSTVTFDVAFDRQDYSQFAVIRGKDKGRGMLPDTEPIIADGVATDEKNIALFLPFADCAAMVLYDPVRSNPRIMLAHIGRHSVEQYGARKAVEFMTFKFGSKPENILAWVGPSPNGETYPIHARNNTSLHDAIRHDLFAAGITSEHIEMSNVDTVTDQNYFSHSEFLKGNRDSDGRYAIAIVNR